MENNMYKIILILSISILITNHANAQQTTNPNIKHDWEDSRYTVNVNNTVTDNKTNLIWKRCAQGLSGSDCMTGTATPHDWQAALDLADNSSLAGLSWRVPNIKELRSIAAYDRYYPAINSAIFPNTPTNDWFWSSSPNAFNSDSAWVLYFYYGYGSGRDRDYGGYVRLVRGGQ